MKIDRSDFGYLLIDLNNVSPHTVELLLVALDTAILSAEPEEVKALGPALLTLAKIRAGLIRE